MIFYTFALDHQGENMTNPEDKTIIVASITGALGRRIAHHLLQKGAKVKGIVRTGSKLSIRFHC